MVHTSLREEEGRKVRSDLVVSEMKGETGAYLWGCTSTVLGCALRRRGSGGTAHCRNEDDEERAYQSSGTTYQSRVRVDTYCR